MTTEHFTYLVCGGTFDHFHKGHREFLLFGLEHSGKLLIGISSDEFAEGRKGEFVEPYEKRKRAVQEFLAERDALSRVEILPIDSVYIPEKWNEIPIEAILVTDDSMQGAQAINQKRKEEGKTPFPILRFGLTQSLDGQTISSSQIREGVIDREGNPLVDSSWYERVLLLPQSLRERLSSPFGEIIDSKIYTFSEEERERLIAVGDVTVMLLHARDIVPKLSVIDLIVERERRYETVEEMHLKNINLTYTVQNTPGQLSPEVFRVIQEAFSHIKQGKNVLLQIIGEEDLVALPILIHAPLGWVICYGQPRVGTVKVVVTEHVKNEVKSMLQEFTIR